MQKNTIAEVIDSVIESKNMARTVAPYHSIVDEVAEAVASKIEESVSDVLAKAADLGYEEQARQILTECGLLTEPEPEVEEGDDSDGGLSAKVDALAAQVKALTDLARSRFGITV